MNRVVFPGINLDLEINNIAFSIFGIEIYWYAIFIVSAIIIAMLILKKRDGLYEIKYDDVLDLALFVIPISIVSARLYYVLFNLGDYINNPIGILEFRTGGLAIYGGIIGGIVTCIILCKCKNIGILDLLDLVAPTLALGQAIGRWGNFVNVEAYGTETTLPWRMGIYEFDEYIEVHPTFLYESIATFVLFIILIRIRDKRKFSGQITCLYFIGYGLARMLIEGLRTDSLMLGQIRVSQLLSVILVIIATDIYIKANKKRKQRSDV